MTGTSAEKSIQISEQVCKGLVLPVFINVSLLNVIFPLFNHLAQVAWQFGFKKKFFSGNRVDKSKRLGVKRLSG